MGCIRTVVCWIKKGNVYMPPAEGGGGVGVLRLIFAWYVPRASQSPNPIIVYSVANYRPHPSHFWANM